MPKETEWIGIKTTRYSTVVRAFLDRYRSAAVRLDGKIENRAVDDWCTNERLCSIINFSIVVDGEVVLSFHDHPRELGAPSTQSVFLEELASRKLLRVERVKPSRTKRSFFGRIFRGRAHKAD